MAAYYSTVNLHFGLGFDKSKLPEGWILKESKSDWARAVTPDGKWYFLGRDKAFQETFSGQIDMKNGVINL